MITGFWEKTKVYCKEHNEEMTIQMHSNTPCYECPVCHSNITCYEFEKMINHFQKIIVDGAMNFEEINLTNDMWKNKVARYTVLEHNNNGMKVSVELNEK